jgi:hypothetical protein
MLSMRTFTIKRLSGETRKKSFVATGDMISGFLGTANAEFTAIVDGEFGKTFSLSSDEFDADLRIGDRIVDSEDSLAEYDVKGVLKNGDGPGRTLQAIVVLPID